MKIYGAGSLEDIRKCTELGVAGILTNPQGFDVYYKGEMTLVEITKAILDNSTGPVFIQVHGPDRDAIVARARELHKMSDRVNAKIIADQKGFEAIRILQQEGLDCIATCLFSISQAAIAAMVGAYGICPFRHVYCHQGHQEQLPVPPEASRDFCGEPEKCLGCK